MADEELLDTEDEESGLAPIGGGERSKLVTILLWVAGALAAIVLMILISYFIARKVKSDAYKEEQNIVIAPAPAPLATFKFQKEFRVNTGRY